MCTAGATPNQSGSSSSLNKLKDWAGSASTFDSGSQHGSDLDVSGRNKYDQGWVAMLNLS